MPLLSPGIDFWLSVLPHLIGPPLVLYTLLNYLNINLTVNLDAQPLRDKQLRALLYVIATPVYLNMRSIWKDLKYRHAAWRRGAKMIPVISGRLPFGIDLIIHMIKSLKNEYAGEAVARLTAKTGSKTVVFRALGGDKGSLHYREPDNLKFMIPSPSIYY